VCPHHYTPDLQACDREFTALSQMLNAVPGCRQVKIGVTEWNIDAGSWGLGRAKQATLEAALMNARYLHVLMRHAEKVRLACRSNLANSYCGAVIETGTGGTGVLRRASYYVMKLYASHTRPIPLALEATNAGLDLFACAAEDRRAGAVFVVNPKNEPVLLSLGFDGFAPGSLAAECVSDCLNAGQPDVMNHWQSPERIRIVSLPIPRANAISLPPLSATAIDWRL
jgi:alpha-L-arabinofuranosidase